MGAEEAEGMGERWGCGQGRRAGRQGGKISWPVDRTGWCRPSDGATPKPSHRTLPHHPTLAPGPGHGPCRRVCGPGGVRRGGTVLCSGAALDCFVDALQAMVVCGTRREPGRARMCWRACGDPGHAVRPRGGLCGGPQVRPGRPGLRTPSPAAAQRLQARSARPRPRPQPPHAPLARLDRGPLGPRAAGPGTAGPRVLCPAGGAPGAKPGPAPVPAPCAAGRRAGAVAGRIRSRSRLTRATASPPFQGAPRPAQTRRHTIPEGDQATAHGGHGCALCRRPDRGVCSGAVLTHADAAVTRARQVANWL